jgi:hypothetical protein
MYLDLLMKKMTTLKKMMHPLKKIQNAIESLLKTSKIRPKT